MGQYLIDNNVISSFFSGSFSQHQMEKIAEILDSVPIISVVTKIEALSWQTNDKTKEQIVLSFVQDAQVMPLTNDVVDKCIEIRRAVKIKTPDAIIAATAIVYNLTLLTSDSDFNKVDGLQLQHPDTL